MSGKACVVKWHIGAVGGLYSGLSHSEGNGGQMRARILTRSL